MCLNLMTMIAQCKKYEWVDFLNASISSLVTGGFMKYRVLLCDVLNMSESLPPNFSTLGLNANSNYEHW